MAEPTPVPPVAEPPKRSAQQRQEDHFRTEAARIFANHQVEVLLEQGVYRHYRCAQPHTINMSFHVVTFPGRLVVCGDIGDMCVERVFDMFTWAPGALRDPSYFYSKAWRNLKLEEFSSEVATEWVEDHFSYVMDDEALSAEKKAAHEETKEDLLETTDERHTFWDAYGSSKWYDGDPPSVRDYTPTAHWCRFALIWFFAWLDKNRPDTPKFPTNQ